MQTYNPQDYNYCIVCLATQTVFNQKYFQIYDNLVFSSRRAFMHIVAHSSVMLHLIPLLFWMHLNSIILNPTLYSKFLVFCCLW